MCSLDHIRRAAQTRSGGEDLIDLLHHVRGDLGPGVFDPSDFADLAALGNAPRPEWAVIEM